MLDPLTRLVLANAIYFKGLWAQPFSPTNTSSQLFHISSINQVDVALMHQPSVSVNYLDTGQFQAVELPYGVDGGFVTASSEAPRVSFTSTRFAEPGMSSSRSASRRSMNSHRASYS